VRLCVVDCSVNPKVTEHHGRLVLVDPEIVEASEETEIAREGCLSIPDFTANVRRAVRVRVRAREVEEFEASGFEARVLQHEIDHLDGLLFLDRVASLKDDVFRRKRYA
jgi:peptide deformylase